MVSKRPAAEHWGRRIRRASDLGLPDCQGHILLSPSGRDPTSLLGKIFRTQPHILRDTRISRPHLSLTRCHNLLPRRRFHYCFEHRKLQLLRDYHSFEWNHLLRPARYCSGSIQPGRRSRCRLGDKINLTRVRHLSISLEPARTDPSDLRYQQHSPEAPRKRNQLFLLIDLQPVVLPSPDHHIVDHNVCLRVRINHTQTTRLPHRTLFD